jgi:hypothetical protein
MECFRMSDSNRYRQVASDMAKRYGVDPELFVSLVQRESGFDPGARGKDGEIGLTQIMSETGINPGYGVTPIQDRNDPVDNLRFGAEYLGALIENYDGDVATALMAYNGGSGNVQKGTISDGAKKYATELMNGKDVQSGSVPTGLVPQAEDKAGQAAIAKGLAGLFADQGPRGPTPLGNVAVPRGFGASSKTSPLSRRGLPGAGAIDQYSTPGGIDGLYKR